MIIDKKIVLVSASPRRKQILLDAGFQFDVRSMDVDECFDPLLAPSQIPETLAHRKVAAYSDWTSDQIIIGADTVVVANGTILNKPADETEAMAMLTALSGTVHEVITGVSVRSSNGWNTFSDTAKVYFKDLSLQEKHYYIQRYQPFDKAGAYGVQDFIGMVGIHRLEGSFYTVMGLPIHRLYDEIQSHIIWKA